MKPKVSDQKDYKKKCSYIKKTVKRYVYVSVTPRIQTFAERLVFLQENAALCDQVCQLQEKIILLQEERSFLMRKVSVLEGTCKFVPEVSENSVALVKPPGKKRDVAWEKLKGRKASSPTVKRKTIVPVAVDSSGLPVFPVVLGSLSVFSLGEIVTDRLNFHDEDVVYPLNYCSTRVYGSLVDPTNPCTYSCMIVDGGVGPL